MMRISGLMAAPFTPFLSDSSALDLALIPAYAAFLSSKGIAGAYICGSTGQGLSLSLSERKAVAEAWVKSAPKDFKVIVNVSHNCVQEACELAAHAQKICAFGTSMTSPSYFKPPSVHELVRLCEKVAASAPSIPFYYYHIPAMTGLTLPMADFLSSAGKSISNLAGLKFSHQDLSQLLKLIQLEDGRFDILYGKDEMMLGGLAVGAKGFIGSTYNYMSPTYLQLIAHFEGGRLKEARECQAKTIRVVDAMIRAGGLPANKAIMKLVGIDCGPVRLPLRQLTQQSEESLFAALKTAGFS